MCPAGGSAWYQGWAVSWCSCVCGGVYCLGEGIPPPSLCDTPSEGGQGSWLGGVVVDSPVPYWRLHRNANTGMAQIT